MPVNTLQQTVDPTGALSELDLHDQDISNIIDQFNQLQDQLNGGNITQNQQNIIVFDNTTNRVLIGYQQVLQQWGLFVSQPGVDVTTATADQLIFNSEQDTFKIVKIIDLSLSVTISPDNTPGYSIVSEPHGLTYIPAYLAYITLDPTVAADGASTTGHIVSPAMTYGTLAGNVSIFSISTVSADATNVYFDTEMGKSYLSGTYNFSAQVYLLQESAVS